MLFSICFVIRFAASLGSSASPTFFAPAPSAASPTLNAASVASCLPMSFAISLRLFPSATPAAIVIGVFTIVSAACCPSSPAATLAALAFFGFSRILAAAFCAMSGAVLAVIFLPSALAPLRVASSAALPMVI